MTLNEAIETYTREHAIETEAKKKADAAKKVILAAAGTGDEITTDAWTVYIKRTPTMSLDTTALYRDFPDIKEAYGKAGERVSLDPHVRSAATEKTA